MDRVRLVRRDGSPGIRPRAVPFVVLAVLAALVGVGLVPASPAGASPAPAPTSSTDRTRGPAVVTREMTWTSAGTVNPYAGGPVDVSCPTTTWCMAVDFWGESMVHDGTRWTNRQKVGPDAGRMPQFRAVSCPTTTFCLAALYDHRLAVWRGSWSIQATDLSYSDVSCWTSSDCGLAGDGGLVAQPDFVRWRNGSVVARVAVPDRAGAADVSCPTAACVFLTGSRTSSAVYAHRMTGTTAYATTAIGTGYQPRVSCWAASACMAVSDGVVRTLSGSTWSSPRRIEDRSVSWMDVAGMYTTSALSCASATACTVIGVWPDTMAAATWDGRSWKYRSVGPGQNTPRAVDCASATRCMVVDQRGRFTRWDGRSWSAPTRFDDIRGGVTDLDCPHAGLCIAADRYGNALEWSSGRGWARTPVGEIRVELDCTGTFCMALDGYHQTKRVRTSAGWQPSRRDTSAQGAVACPTSTRCFAVSGRSVWTVTPTSDVTVPATLPADVSTAVGDCPTATFCLFVGQNGRALSWNGSRWSTRGFVPGGAAGNLDVDCLSASWCVVAGDAAVAVLTPTAWRLIDSRPALSVTCRTTTWCLALGHDHGLRSWTGSRWTDTGRSFGDGSSSDGRIRCAPGMGRCTVVVDARAWHTG